MRQGDAFARPQAGTRTYDRRHAGPLLTTALPTRDGRGGSVVSTLGPTLPWLPAAWLVALSAGVVRGFSGFGFSALTVAGLALFVSPASVVPSVLALEVLASLSLLRGALRDADRRWLTWLLAGNLLCVPVGLALLAWLPELTLRLLVGVVLLCGALGLLIAGDRSWPPSTPLRAVTGVLSGLMNGITASGGVAAAMLMTAARVPPSALRATMISFLLFTGAYALAWASLLPTAAGARLLGVHTLLWMAQLGPAMLVGIWLGRRSFHGVSAATYRRVVLWLLVAISALGVLRAGTQVLTG